MVNNYKVEMDKYSGFDARAQQLIYTSFPLQMYLFFYWYVYGGMVVKYVMVSIVLCH